MSHVKRLYWMCSGHGELVCWAFAPEVPRAAAWRFLKVSYKEQINLGELTELVTSMLDLNANRNYVKIL